MNQLVERFGVVKGNHYVVLLHASGYTDAEYIGFGGFRLADGSTVFPKIGHVREIHPYIP